MRNIYKTTAIGVMVAALAGATGCATSGDLEKVSAEVAKANATASQAASDAAAAKRDAAAAKATADQANATANATSEKLDRMFKKSMNK
jgi:murein lipoprotein